MRHRMSTAVTIFCSIAVAGLFAVTALAAHSETLTGVPRVIDGDTLRYETDAGKPIWELTSGEVPDSWIGTTHIPATMKEDEDDG